MGSMPPCSLPARLASSPPLRLTRTGPCGSATAKAALRPCHLLRAAAGVIHGSGRKDGHSGRTERMGSEEDAPRGVKTARRYGSSGLIHDFLVQEDSAVDQCCLPKIFLIGT